MSDPSRSDEPEGEVVEGLPVLATPHSVEVGQPLTVPARQAAALAATSFVAGAATAAVVARRRARLVRRRRRRKAAGTLGEVVASNSFLIDIHLLRRD